MPYIRKIRKSKWYKNTSVPWLKENDIQADALVDLETTGNELSVYYIDEDKTNIDQLAVALALSCEYISNVDLAIIKEEEIKKINIGIKKTNGETADEKVNKTHFDLVETTAQNILDLAKVIISSEKIRKNEIFLRNEAAKALKEKRIDFSKIKLLPDSLEKIQELAKNIKD